MNTTSIRNLQYTITLLGDVMLGRLIDQLLPEHVEEPEDARHVAFLRRSDGSLRDYSTVSPWGNALNLLKASDLVLANLETAVTTWPEKWPNKVFNYRMHPANIECLRKASVAYVSLANNHTLDFNREGLFETIDVLERASIAFAGVGRTSLDAERPAVLRLPRKGTGGRSEQSEYEIHLHSFSDHPADWASVHEFNHIKYDEDARGKMRRMLLQTSAPSSLKVVSIHWGPNYSWTPDAEIESLAHYLIDECGVDIIHGHSSHHIQGVEVRKGKLIIYGCGDFVDDYAIVSEYRNDLSAVWNVILFEGADGKLAVKKLEVHPNRIRNFRAELLEEHDSDHAFVCDRFRTLSAGFGTLVHRDLGDQGQIIVDMAQNTL